LGQSLLKLLFVHIDASFIVTHAIFDLFH
jgi:hypothetical protein